MVKSQGVSESQHSHILLTGEGGGGSKGFFWSEILAKRDFFGSMKDTGNFLGCGKNTGIFWGIALFISNSIVT